MYFIDDWTWLVEHDEILCIPHSLKLVFFLCLIIMGGNSSCSTVCCLFGPALTAKRPNREILLTYYIDNCFVLSETALQSGPVCQEYATYIIECFDVVDRFKKTIGSKSKKYTRTTWASRIYSGNWKMHLMNLFVQNYDLMEIASASTHYRQLD